MSTTAKHEDALRSAALSEPNRRDHASSVPLSEYLQTNVDSDDDGWTIYASNEEEKPPVDRPRDLSVLKSIKRFLAEETPRDVDASSFDGSSYRVEYPFYDAEQAARPTESPKAPYSYNEQITFEPDAVRYEKVETAPNTDESIEEDSATEIVVGEKTGAPRELDEPENVEAKEVDAEEETPIVVEGSALDAPRAVEEIVVAPEKQSFVVDFGELVEPAFERLERGIDAPELPLIASFVKSRKRREAPSAPSREPVLNEPTFVVESVEPT
ncbi:MAG: hypothetical protein J6X44_12680, partial [Thermoguttaceae bacterium]|nr:hypothetical protein [Thermoguttaceae bacterium]